MAANILVTDDRCNALKKTISGVCDIAIFVSERDAPLIYVVSPGIIKILARESCFACSRKVRGVDLFSIDAVGVSILDRLGTLCGSVMTKYELFGDPDDGDVVFFDDIGLI